MTTILLEIVVGFAVLGILVFVHELGHFLVAKWCGVRVLAFSIGFGKPLVAKTIGGTEYRIGSVPFGGYVHMAGEHPEDGRENAPDEFPSKPIWQRGLVAVAGPAANFIFAFVNLWFAFMWGIQQEVFLDRPVVGAVADSSAAKIAGICAGDSILSVNGAPVRSWDDIERQTAFFERQYRLVLVRGGETKSLTLNMPKASGYKLPRHPAGGMLPSPPAVVGSVNPGSPAQQSGLKTGDVIAKINGDTVRSWFELSMVVSHYDSSSGPLRVCVSRKDSVFSILARPSFDAAAKRYLLGISAGASPTRTVRFGPLAAASKALDKSWEYTKMIFDVLQKLASKQVSPQQLAGPIGIVQMSGLAAVAGLVAILNFMALIGVNLAVINLFPLVITDGGMILFLLLEAVRGKPLSLKAQERINRVAISFFILLFVYITFNDVRRVPEMFKLFGK